MHIRKYSLTDSFSYTQMIEIANSYAEEYKRAVSVIEGLINTRNEYEKKIDEYESIIKKLNSKIEDRDKEKKELVKMITKKLTLKERILGKKIIDNF